MSDFSKFMKANKKVQTNEFYAATESLVDEKGKPLMWELRHISSKEIDEITESCTHEEQITGKYGQTRTVIDRAKLGRKLVCAAIVNPDLNDAKLQDSYGVKTPEALIIEMLDDAGEYSMLSEKVTRMNHLDKSLEDKINEAKNL